MEAMNKSVILAVLMVLIVGLIHKAEAADAPAPGPSSDATLFLPSFIASLAALAFGLFF